MDDRYLDKDNIARSGDGVEYHPLRPFLPSGCKVLFLGSFPPQRKRWCCNFFYPNFTNDHWRIEGQVFFGDRNYFVDEPRKTFRLDRIIPFLERKGIGFYDTATAVRRLRDNASDKFLEVVEPTDVAGMLRSIPDCRVREGYGNSLCHALRSRNAEDGRVCPYPYAGVIPKAAFPLPSPVIVTCLSPFP